MNWKYNHDADGILEALNITDDVKKLLLTIGPSLEIDKEIDSDSKFIEAFLKQVKNTSDLLDTPQSIFNMGFVLGQFLARKYEVEPEAVLDTERVEDFINLEKIQAKYDEREDEF